MLFLVCVQIKVCSEKCIYCNANLRYCSSSSACGNNNKSYSMLKLSNVTCPNAWVVLSCVGAVWGGTSQRRGAHGRRDHHCQRSVRFQGWHGEVRLGQRSAGQSDLCSISTHTHRRTHTHTHARTHAHTHARTHAHNDWFLWFMGTLHRRNGFYTVQTVCAIALHLPYT